MTLEDKKFKCDQNSFKYYFSTLSYPFFAIYIYRYEPTRMGKEHCEIFESHLTQKNGGRTQYLEQRTRLRRRN